jgi:selenocysteine lyase/cysteine desulfurase
MALDIDAVRACFPALALTHDGGPRIYLDNPAVWSQRSSITTRT